MDNQHVQLIANNGSAIFTNGNRYLKGTGLMNLVLTTASGPGATGKLRRKLFNYFIVPALLIQLGALCAQAQNINTVAGNFYTGPGYIGDGGPATAANLFYPTGVIADNSGDYFIADNGNSVIREVNAAGIISTVAGSYFAGGGYSGDGAPATDAALNAPYGVAMDAAGNIYFSDQLNNVVRMVNTSGIITTIAGNFLLGGLYSGDGAAATAAALNEPAGIAVDLAGNIYIADEGNNVIREVNTAGIISTVAGSFAAGFGYTGDGGPATAAGLSEPAGVAVDASGNIYIADAFNNVIRMVNTSGIINTVVGSTLGFGGYSGDGGPAIAAELNEPADVKLDNYGKLYIADEGNNVIRLVNTGGIISTVAGNFLLGGGYSGDGGPATGAALASPSGVAVDNWGNIYLADEFNSVIREVGTIIGASGVCVGTTTTLSDITTGGTWSSASTAIATVDPSSGVVTGVSVGNTTISYTIPGYTATMTFYVASPPAAITGTLTVCNGSETLLSDATTGGSWSSASPDTAFLFDPTLGEIDAESAGTAEIYYSSAPGCSAEVTVTVLAAPSSIFGSTDVCIGTPTGFSDGTTGGTWSPGSTAIATVGPLSGTLTPVAAGETSLIYSLSDGCVDSEYVEVYAMPTAGTITGPSSVCVGATVGLSDAALGGDWTSSSGGVTASVDFFAGTVLGVSAGPDVISYQVSNICGTATATASFTVLAGPDAGTVTGTTTICADSSTHLTDAATGGVWSSGSTAIATVSSSGTVYGVSAGPVSIVYSVTNSCGTATATASFTILGPPDAGMVTGADTICKDSSINLTDAATGGVWSSTGTSVATVSLLGTVYGASTGTASIIYTVNNGCGTATADLSVRVIVCKSHVSTASVALPADRLEVYPNPNSGTFSVNVLSDMDEQARIVVTNTVGEKVMEFNMAANKTEQVIIPPANGAGIYFITATTGSGRYTTKIIVE